MKVDAGADSARLLIRATKRCRIALEPGPALLRQYLLARENGAGRIDADTQCQDPGVIHGAGDLGRALQTGTCSVSAVQYDKEEPWHGRSRSNLRSPAISERTNKRNGIGPSCLGAILTLLSHGQEIVSGWSPPKPPARADDSCRVRNARWECFATRHRAGLILPPHVSSASADRRCRATAVVRTLGRTGRIGGLGWRISGFLRLCGSGSR
jgi:hypothetical protein